uniref:hypothetical protein n=1 Tax=Oribacterium sinus TaxID=237576 RepID=UPI0028E583BF
FFVPHPHAFFADRKAGKWQKDPSGDPSLEKKSEPDQKKIEINDKINHILTPFKEFSCFFRYFYTKY